MYCAAVAVYIFNFISFYECVCVSLCCFFPSFFSHSVTVLFFHSFHSHYNHFCSELFRVYFFSSFDICYNNTNQLVFRTYTLTMRIRRNVWSTKYEESEDEGNRTHGQTKRVTKILINDDGESAGAYTCSSWKRWIESEKESERTIEWVRNFSMRESNYFVLQCKPNPFLVLSYIIWYCCKFLLFLMEWFCTDRNYNLLSIKCTFEPKLLRNKSHWFGLRAFLLFVCLQVCVSARICVCVCAWRLNQLLPRPYVCVYHFSISNQM